MDAWTKTNDNKCSQCMANCVDCANDATKCAKCADTHFYKNN